MIKELAGWIPAVVLPLSTLIQWITIVKNKSCEGVSIWSWTLFGLANAGAYLFVDKYASIQAIMAFLLSAALDVLIVLTLIKMKARARA